MRLENAARNVRKALTDIEGEAKRMRFLRHHDAANKLQGIANELDGLKDRLAELATQKEPTP